MSDSAQKVLSRNNNTFNCNTMKRFDRTMRSAIGVSIDGTYVHMSIKYNHIHSYCSFVYMNFDVCSTRSIEPLLV